MAQGSEARVADDTGETVSGHDGDSLPSCGSCTGGRHEESSLVGMVDDGSYALATCALCLFFCAALFM